MRPNLAPRLPSRLTPQNPPRVSGYTASVRTLTRSSLPGPCAMEIKKCVHRSQQHHYHQYHPHQSHRSKHYYHHKMYYPHQQYRHYLTTNFEDYEEDEDYDEGFRQYPRLSLQNAPGTLTFVNLLVKRFLCFFTCSPCGLRSTAY